MGRHATHLDVASRPDEEILAFDTHFVAAHAVAPSIGSMTIAKIEGEIVPGTGHDESLDMPFTERPTLVRAGIRKGKKLIGYVEHCNGPILHADDFDLPGRNVFGPGNLVKPFHVVVFPSSRSGTLCVYEVLPFTA